MHDVPESIRRLLLAAAAEEGTAAGPDLREANRTTRYLLAGCRRAGVPVPGLAALLDVRVEAIRSRGSSDGIVSGAAFARLSGMTLDDVTRWQRDGLLPPATPDALHRTGYPASALVAAMLSAGETPA
ncbi:hypothetical protein [Clavibacter sp. VKM Ac-2872]|uniref:hypothetical protein n=1 Tax=Clavibacter sp. VKM Ac-2872 TaxID=2783812 RepID=UPI00188B21AC|nr:hypothetical protein [Clavibacter sp. VKM Ac-2872]MBF4625789.1 hypothetical protein [Clavibacter sp. VKM Ac-2872]